MENISLSTQLLIDSLILTEDEDLMPQKFWSEMVEKMLNHLSQYHSLLIADKHTVNPPSVQLLILIGGILGNRVTSKYLHSDSALAQACTDVLSAIKERCDVVSIRQLLLLPPLKSSKPHCDNLCTQFIRLTVSKIAQTSTKASTIDPLNTHPLHRDAILWLCVELNYPELANEEFVGVIQPLGLRLTTDHRSHLRLAGFRILQELANKARLADWRQSNRAEAVIHQLFDQHIGSSPNFSESVLRELYKTLFVLVRLLPPTKQHEFNLKLADRLLFDLTMENRIPNQGVLLRFLSELMDHLESTFAMLSRQFMRVVSIILLGPRCPTHLRQQSVDGDSQDETVYVLMLECVGKLITSCWPLVSPSLISGLIPPLVAFVDLEAARCISCGVEPSLVSPAFQQLKQIFSSLIRLDPRVYHDILLSACSCVPHLKSLMPVQPVPSTLFCT